MKERLPRQEVMGGGSWRLSRSLWAMTSPDFLPLCFSDVLLSPQAQHVRSHILPSFSLNYITHLTLLFNSFPESLREYTVGIFGSFLFIALQSHRVIHIPRLALPSIMPTAPISSYTVTCCLGYGSGLLAGRSVGGHCPHLICLWSHCHIDLL